MSDISFSEKTVAKKIEQQPRRGRIVDTFHQLQRQLFRLVSFRYEFRLIHRMEAEKVR
jgi:hypothetical protein